MHVGVTRKQGFLNHAGNSQVWGGAQHTDATQEMVVASTNSIGYQNSVNVARLCGYNDWRMPTETELASLFDKNVPEWGDVSRQLAINPWFFRNTEDAYWGSTGLVNSSTHAAVFAFTHGHFQYRVRNGSSSVRLVR